MIEILSVDLESSGFSCPTGPAGPPGPGGAQPTHFLHCKECEVNVQPSPGACGGPWVYVSDTAKLCQLGLKLWTQYQQYLDSLFVRREPLNHDIERDFSQT